MEQLGYYTPPSPGILRSGKRRAIAAGVLLLLVGAGLCLLLLPLLFEILKFRDSRGELAAMTTAWTGFTSLAACLMMLGVGLIQRSRWSRTPTRIAMNVWLTFGVSLLAVIGVLESIDTYRGRYLFSTQIDWYIENGFIVMLTVGLPWLVKWLVEATSVAVAIAHSDFKPRWTDRLHTRRATVIANLLVLALIIAVYDVTALTQLYWNAVDRLVNIGFAISAALLLGSAAVVFANRRHSRPIAMVMSIAAFGLCLYFGSSRYAGRFFHYRDSAGILGFLLCVHAICVMQIWRTGWPEKKVAEA